MGRSTVINDDPGANDNRVFREIAVAQAEAGDATGAVAAVSGRGAEDWKAETLATIAPIQARLGDIAGALDTTRKISDPGLAGEAYTAIAMTQARAGDANAAMARVARLETPAARAFALIGIADGFAARKAGDRHAKP